MRMPRNARILLPNYPHHVIHRDHNRQVVFSEAADHQDYLDNLWVWKEQLGYRVYAYCVMTNHVHLGLDPGRIPARLRLLMKRVAGRPTRYVNALEGRSGTLGAGELNPARFKALTPRRPCLTIKIAGTDEV